VVKLLTTQQDRRKKMGLDMYLGVRTSEGTQEVGYWRKANAIHGWFVRELADGVDECQEIPVSKIKLMELQALCLTALVKRSQDPAPLEETESPKSSKSVPVEGEELGEWLANQMKMETTLALLEKQFEDTSDPLRPVAGFFFGGTEKDQYYYADLLQTAEIIAEALQNYPDGEFIYQASW
jgi:hypothetical protein